MKPLENHIIKILLILIISLASASCEVMLYPLARAFGNPSESEFKVFRKNFIDLQENISTSKIAVFPPGIVNDQKQEWQPDVAKQMAEIMQQRTAIDAYDISEMPDLEFTPVGRSQSRFQWKRVEAYSAWVAEAQPVPAGDFIMFTDFICSPDSNCQYVGGVNVYVSDAQGNISIASVINSKHGIYHRVQPDSFRDCAVMAVERLNRVLSMDVMDFYPPYGIG